MEAMASEKEISAVGDGLPIVPGPATYFAPAERDTAAEIRRKAGLLQGISMLGEVLDAMPGPVMLLNANRQIVGANEPLLDLLGAALAEVITKRPGEALGCIRAEEGPTGCGTDRHCVTCGAVNAILESQKADGIKVVRECRVLAQSPSGIVALDLRVTASSFRIGDDLFVLAAVEDISQAKRLAVLQRTFFHDVLNTAGCIRGYADLLEEDGAGDREIFGRLGLLSEQLIESIQAHRDLVFAESGDLRVEPAPLRTMQILEDLRVQYARHAVAQGRTLAWTKNAWDGTVVADRAILLRVLGNMVKNALEATGPGGTVTLNCLDRGDEVAFSVHNAEIMPEEVQLQVFQRSFSTKSPKDRGIGTYSMKLFGERYLGGKVAFTSAEPVGTTFTLTIPKKTRQDRK